MNNEKSDKMVLRMPYQAYVKDMADKNSCRRTVRLPRDLDKAVCIAAKEMNVNPGTCLRHLVFEGLKSKKKI